MHRHLCLFAAASLAACSPTAPPAGPAPAAQTPAPAPAVAAVVPGVEVFAERPLAVLQGKRVGLITNHSGITRARRSTIDVLAATPGVTLVALFSPEHGIRGVAAEGEHVASGKDEQTGLPIHSLYGGSNKPTPAMLQGVDALVFDMQDVGARQYTYVYTMALAMQAAAEKKIPFVVFDRPNPIGGEIIEGGLLEPAHSSFVGMYPIPSRHGMTVGELARLFNQRFGIGADLSVVPVQGWRRDQWFDETGLPWVNPSPNLRRLEAAIHYPGTVYLEGTNLSEGRGSEMPFEQTGAPWLDAPAVAAEMNALGLPGVRFEAVSFAVAQKANKFAGQTIPGVRLVLTDREAYRPLRATLLLIDAIRRRHPQQFQWSGSLTRLAGTERLRQAAEAGTLPALLAEWEREAEAFRESRRPFLLY